MVGSTGTVLQSLLDGERLVKKPASLSLLSGLGAQLRVASSLPSRSANLAGAVSSGTDALDRVLAGGLPKGGIVEIAGRSSSGRFALGLAALAAATGAGESAALVDLGGHLEPRGAEEAGVDLARLLWVRPTRVKEALAAGEMLLATGFPLVVLDLGLLPVSTRFIPDAAWVRLSRSAAAQGVALLLLSPNPVAGFASGALVAAETARAVWRGSGVSPRLLEEMAGRLTLRKGVPSLEGRGEKLTLSVRESLDDRRRAAPARERRDPSARITRSA